MTKLLKNAFYKNKEWLYKKYVSENLTSHEIVKHCGAKTHKTILLWLKKYEIKKRNCGTKNGSKHSKEHKDAISIGCKLNPSNGMLGKRHKKLSLMKISKNNIGKHSELKSEECKEKIRLANLGKKASKETKEKMSKTLLRKYKNGERTAYSHKKFFYKNNCFKSSWELKLAKFLDLKNIKFEYESKICRFNLPNNRTYIIDFYLPSYKLFIEVKGWYDDYSKYKIKEASKKLNFLLIDKSNINNLENIKFF